MSLACSVCGRAPRSGNRVSKANNRTRRRFLPNLQTVRAQVGRSVRRLRVCTRCIRGGKVARARRRPPVVASAASASAPAAV